MRYILLFSAALFLASCGNHTENNGSATTGSATTPADAPVKDTILKKMTDGIVHALKVGKYSDLALYIHPQEGVRVSLEAFVNKEKNLVLHTADLASLDSTKKYNWGTYDAVEEDIMLTIPAFVRQFEYAFGYFLTNEKTQYNLNKSVTHGATVNNLAEVYPNCDYTEYYVDSFAKDPEVDLWIAMRMVYKKEGDNYYLVGLIVDRPGV